MLITDPWALHKSRERRMDSPTTARIPRVAEESTINTQLQFLSSCIKGCKMIDWLWAYSWVSAVLRKACSWIHCKIKTTRPGIRWADSIPDTGTTQNTHLMIIWRAWFCLPLQRFLQPYIYIQARSLFFLFLFATQKKVRMENGWLQTATGIDCPKGGRRTSRWLEEQFMECALTIAIDSIGFTSSSLPFVQHPHLYGWLSCSPLVFLPVCDTWLFSLYLVFLLEKEEIHDREQFLYTLDFNSILNR